jgi:hypothetical protein
MVALYIVVSNMLAKFHKQNYPLYINMLQDMRKILLHLSLL